MKLPVRILLCLLCAAMVLAIPFTVSSPKLLEDAQWEIIDQMQTDESEEEEEAASWLNLLFPSARAEEEAQVEEEKPKYELPIDLNPKSVPKPNPANFTKEKFEVDGKTHVASYEDDTIRVTMEKREEDGSIWNIAWVEIASPTQLRTGVAATNDKDQNKVKSDRSVAATKIAARYNAVVAINGSHYFTEKERHRFEIRMGLTRDKRSNAKRDILIIDQNGDFHIFVNSEGALSFEKNTGLKIVNACMFGPALVKDGQVLKTRADYGFNATKPEPRAAIGQLGKLSYVFVVCDGRGKSGSDGATHQELAKFMGSLGCQQAYNLDGGGSAILIMADPSSKEKDKIDQFSNKRNEERDASDIFFFATAIPESEWK